VKCPHCGAPATQSSEDEPSAWFETDDAFVSLHRYQCLVTSEHVFFLEHCHAE